MNSYDFDSFSTNLDPFIIKEEFNGIALYIKPIGDRLPSTINAYLIEFSQLYVTNWWKLVSIPLEDGSSEGEPDDKGKDWEDSKGEPNGKGWGWSSCDEGFDGRSGGWFDGGSCGLFDGRSGVESERFFESGTSKSPNGIRGNNENSEDCMLEGRESDGESPADDDTNLEALGVGAEGLSFD